MRHINLYDSISCLNCLACMSACSMENRMRSERDAGVSLERGSTNTSPGPTTCARGAERWGNTRIHVCWWPLSTAGTVKTPSA